MASKMAAPFDQEAQLQINNLDDLLDLLKRHSYSGTTFYRFGLHLGLSATTMDVIEKDYTGDTNRCLRECLVKWLQKADEVEKKGGPTIQSLVFALEKVNEKSAAENIDKEKHPACRILAGYISNESLVIALPQLVLLLNSQKLIKEMMLPANVQGDTLLVQIKKAVCNDYRKLEAFAVILWKNTTTAEIGKAIMKEYRDKYCSNDLIETDENSATRCPKFYLPSKMASEFKSMRVKFGDTFKKVGSIIEKGPNPTLNDVKKILRFSCKPLRPQIAECKDINDILEVISDSSSLIDISILEGLVDRLNIDDAKVVVLEYNEAVEELNKKGLTQCLGEIFSSISPLQCETITILVDKKDAELILDDVRIYLKNFFGNFSPLVKLHVIEEDNSFTITCSFPLILSEQLITAALNNIDVLKENKVKRLTIGYCTVYEVNDTPTSTTTELPGLFKQLVLSLSVELINSKVEVNTLNEENLTYKKENESLRELNSFKIMENEISRQKSDETGQLLHAKLIESEADGASNVVKKLLPISPMQLPTFQPESNVIAYCATLSEPEAVSKMTLEDNNGIEQSQKSLESVKSILQEQASSMSDEMEVRILEMKQKLVEKETEIEMLQERLSSMSLKAQQRQNYLTFEDDFYNFIKIDHPLLIKIVKTEQFTRLKHIRKLGYIYHNMSRAAYSRYDQSIGMYYFAGKFVKRLKKRQPELNITDSDVLCVQIAALCYNLGFGPFSHIFADFLKKIKASRQYWKGQSASVMMFQHMIEANELPFHEYFDNHKEDIEFIEELMTGKMGAQAAKREDKVFLYEIVVNRMSGLDVNRIDYTMRDTVVLGPGKRINFSWRNFLNRISVKMCPDGKKHICVIEEDLNTYNGFFTDRHTLFKDLYFERKNRIVATMINRILIKCGDAKFIKGREGTKVSLIDAIKSMDTYCRLNDGILEVIKETVVDPEVEKLINFLRRSKLFIPIGYVKNCQLDRGAEQLKEEIANEEGLDIDDIIVDTAKSGYEGATKEVMYYISSDGTVKQWTKEWQLPPTETFPAPWRVFFTKHNKELVAKMKSGLRRVIDEKGGFVDTYDNETDIDLIPEEDPPAPQ